MANYFVMEPLEFSQCSRTTSPSLVSPFLVFHSFKIFIESQLEFSDIHSLYITLS